MTGLLTGSTCQTGRELVILQETAYDSSPAQSARRLFPWPVQSDPSAMSSSKLLQHCRFYYRLQQKWPTDDATTDSGSPLSNSTEHTMWQVHTPANICSEYHICWCLCTSSGTLIIVSQDIELAKIWEPLLCTQGAAAAGRYACKQIERVPCREEVC